MPTLEQIRAARALLGWSQSDLADRADLSQTGIARIENGTNKPNSSTLDKITQAFDKSEIEFLNDSGVRKRSGELKVYKGADGFRAFMDDVRETIAEVGGEVCLFNARPEYWYKWLGEDWYKKHSERMQAIDNGYDFKVTVKEGEDLLIGNDFVEYRWFPEGMFNERAFYAYGPKIGFLHFSENDVKVRVLHNQEFADGFRVLFNVGWENVAIKIKGDG